MKALFRRAGWLALVASLGLSTAAPIQEQYQGASVFGYDTSGVYDATDTYCDGRCTASLNPLQPANLARGGTANFLGVLQAAFPVASGWTFAAAGADLTNGSLRVRTYDVQGTDAQVGAEFHVQYVPGAGDPTENIHWIQVVTDNHNVTNNPGHGNNENIVDNPFSPAGRAPYYDDGAAANGTHFYDFAVRTDAKRNHTWIADLYLVVGPAANAPGQVTIYSGIQWGWENTCIPEPSTYSLLLLSGPVLLVLRRRMSS